METGRTAMPFRTTSWTLIVRARASQTDLEELLRRYWGPVYAFLRRTGRSRHEAEDLTQAFLSDVVLRRDLIGRADPERGRFRSYLLTALKRFVIDVHRHESGDGVAHRSVFVPRDSSELAAMEPAESDDPARAFDRQWAATVFQAALERTEAACNAKGMNRHWRAFESRIVRPMLHGCEAMPTEDLMAELEVREPQEIYDMIRTVKRKVRGSLRDVIEETVEDPSEIEEELGELREYLAVG